MTASQQQRKALEQCLSVLLCMIPECCHEHGLEQVSNKEHDAAIRAAALALYGCDRRRWRDGARKAAAGGYP